MRSPGEESHNQFHAFFLQGVLRVGSLGSCGGRFANGARPSCAFSAGRAIRKLDNMRAILLWLKKKFSYGDVRIDERYK
jgi:hypothetical protein